MYTEGLALVVGKGVQINIVITHILADFFETAVRQYTITSFITKEQKSVLFLNLKDLKYFKITGKWEFKTGMYITFDLE